MATPVQVRVSKHRVSLRAAGLRPVQLWVPDTRQPGFAEACRRQLLKVNRADAKDRALQDFLDASVESIEGWTV